MAITLSQLARELGVSTMTVSRALRGVGRIGEGTRDRIVSAARRHGYRPHALARAMRSGRSGCVALFMDARSCFGALSRELAVGIDHALTSRGMYLAVTCLPDGMGQGSGAVPRLLGEWMADGMLLDALAEPLPKALEQLRERHVPCVWMNAKRGQDCVYCDDYDAARRATQRLLQLGHRRIAFANHLQSRVEEGAEHSSAEDRYRGYASVLKESGLPTRRVYRHPLVSFVEMWRAFLSEPANQRPTAVVCYSRFTAHPILIAAAQVGVQVPRDLSLVSFDEEPALEFEFPLATLVVPQRQVGVKAVEMLCAKMENHGEPIEGVALLADWFDGGTMVAPSRTAMA